MNLFERSMWLLGYVKVEKGEGILVRPHYRKPSAKKRDYTGLKITYDEMRSEIDKLTFEELSKKVSPAQLKEWIRINPSDEGAIGSTPTAPSNAPLPGQIPLPGESEQ